MLKQYNLFLFDMDGTLYLGDQLYDFTKELLGTIRAKGKRYLFMTNNSSKSVADYVKKLAKLGIEATEEDFITSSQATAYYLKVPMIILKKQASKIIDGTVYQTRITSFTKGTSYELTLYKEYLNEDDRVILIDDFLANGEVAVGASRLIEMSGAKLEGIGVLIEKSFQRGRQRLIDAGYDVFSLARIKKMSKDKIEFISE